MSLAKFTFPQVHLPSTLYTPHRYTKPSKLKKMVHQGPHTVNYDKPHPLAIPRPPFTLCAPPTWLTSDHSHYKWVWNGRLDVERLLIECLYMWYTQSSELGESYNLPTIHNPHHSLNLHTHAHPLHPLLVTHSTHLSPHPTHHHTFSFLLFFCSVYICISNAYTSSNLVPFFTSSMVWHDRWSCLMIFARRLKSP